jgi:hypothetical protein
MGISVKTKRDNKETHMNNKRAAIVTILMFGLLAAGCAQSTANVSKMDSVYSTSMHLIFQPGFADRSFRSSRDYSLSTEFNNVSYIWPEGKGKFIKKSNEITFEGKSINCSVVERRLTINERPAGQFEEGDRVRITGDGKVFVNEAELKSPGDI